MAIINKFGTLEVTLDGSGDYAVKLKDGFRVTGEDGETMEELASSVLRQVGLKLIQQKDGVHPSIRERMERDNGGR